MDRSFGWLVCLSVVLAVLVYYKDVSLNYLVVRYIFQIFV